MYSVMESAIKLTDIAAHFNDEDSARAFFEAKRWPDGPVCPHCGVVGTAYKLNPKPGSKTRKGLYKCADCREQFTVTVGTIFEDSHLPLHKWLFAIHLMCASKKGMSAHQLHRMLGVTYKTAWFMAHRIRYAMSQPPLRDKLKGTIECDETYVGGREKNKHGGRPGWTSKKQPVFSLVERDGRVRSFHMRRVTSENLLGVMKDNIAQHSVVMTDDFGAYTHVKKHYPMHSVIKHSQKVYSISGPWGRVHTNTVEGYFGLLKRGINGTFHHVGEQHLFRYLAEFDFRYNTRTIKDGERTLEAIKGAEGKRLTLKQPSTSEAF